MIDAEGVDRVVDRIRTVNGVVVEYPRGRRQRVVVEIVLSHCRDTVCGNQIALEGSATDDAVDCLLRVGVEDLAAMNRRAIAWIRSKYGCRQQRRKIAVTHGRRGNGGRR